MSLIKLMYSSKVTKNPLSVEYIIKVRMLGNRRDTIRRSVQIVKMGVPVVRSKISAIYKPEYINYRSEMGHGDFQIKAATWIK